MIPPKRFDIFPLTGGCSEGLGASRFFLKLPTGIYTRYYIYIAVIIYDHKRAIEPYSNRGLGQDRVKMSGRDPPLYCTLTLIAMQGHRPKQKDKTHDKLELQQLNLLRCV